MLLNGAFAECLGSVILVTVGRSFIIFSSWPFPAGTVRLSSRILARSQLATTLSTSSWLLERHREACVSPFPLRGIHRQRNSPPRCSARTRAAKHIACSPSRRTVSPGSSMWANLEKSTDRATMATACCSSHRVPKTKVRTPGR